MILPDDLVLRPAVEAAQRIALRYLDQSCAAAERLLRGDDAEALHDFRVALRRLRCCARAHRKHLQSTLDKRDRRDLGRVQRGTSGARDLEVQLEHVRRFQRSRSLADTQKRSHTPAPSDDVTAAGIEAFAVELQRRLSATNRQTVHKAVTRYLSLEPALRDALSHVRVSLVAEEATYGAVLAGIAREHGATLIELLEGSESVDSREPLHDARLAAKRLRYLLEPVAPKSEHAAALVATCKRLQSLLGCIQDMHVLMDTLDTARGAASPPTLVGIEVLIEAAQDDAAKAFEELRSTFLSDRLPELIADVERFAAALDGARQTETERKYLLDGLPAEARAGHPCKELRQGYLPGETLRERLRSVAAESGVKYLRTIKGGGGVQRIEVEEETDQRVFDQMWPLTYGARVHKRRYAVRDGALTWVVDEFLDRDLVLAEVELPSPKVQPPIPLWMAPHLVREVTGEDDYANITLAC